MSSLKQFIRNVRAAKTIADERAVIQKESAAIRASFREESADHTIRRNNVAKLLYLFTLGERTHFGQIECIKLLASPRFADKRLGHLATSLLLDENQEVLTLVTNSLKNDLGHSNQYIVGLALCTLGNIASVEMSRDLFPEIENLIATSNPYIRRKAALCAMRICRKVPDLQEHFIQKATQLLADRNHGVLLCGLTLVTSLCEADEEEGGEEGIVEKFRAFVPALVKTLKGLSTSGYAPEHDVTGITDPFVQVKILRLLRILAIGDVHTSEQINDILAQVATNTDSSKNVGNSILYEAVLTILDIEADSGLRVLGVNILGKFLSNKDNNIRYVALNTLIKVVAIEPNAVQRHRNTILECLRDPDISIRRRALDLSFTLINESNVRVLIRELLAFLEVADNEFKPTMTSQIGIAADKFAPNKRWHFDTMLRVLSLAGNYVKEQILSSFIRLIATTPELQTYAVQKLYTNLKKDITQESLTQAGAWCIGEYADALLRGGQYEEEELVKEVKENEVVDLFSLVLNSSYGTQVTTEYIVTALMKLTTRFSDPAQVERVRRILQSHQTSLDVEVQQRAVEYGNLFSYDQIRRGVLEKMPPPQIKEESRVLGPAPTKKSKAANRKSRVIKPTEQDLLDIMDTPASTGPMNGSSTTNSDLLADILGGGPASPPSGATSPQPTNNMSSIMDLFGSGPAPSTSSPAPPSSGLDLLAGASSPAPVSHSPAPPAAPAGLPCYDANDLNVTFQVQRNAEGMIQASARFQNNGSGTLSNVGLQAAVPKTQRLQLQSISSTELGPGASATQIMRVTGCNGPLRLRLRIGYTHPAAGQVMDQIVGYCYAQRHTNQVLLPVVARSHTLPKVHVCRQVHSSHGAGRSTSDGKRAANGTFGEDGARAARRGIYEASDAPQGLHAVTLSRIDQVNARIRLLRLELQAGHIKAVTDSNPSPQFLAGQWLDTFVPGQPKPGGFTITCPPSAAAAAGATQTGRDGPPYLELAVQDAPDNAAAAWLWRPARDILGATLHVRVGGSFVFPPLPSASGRNPPSFSRVVFVAGGVGVNPLMSMLSHVAETEALRRGLDGVDVLYGSRTSREDEDPSLLHGVLFCDRIRALFRGPDGDGSLGGRLRLFLTGAASAVEPSGETTAAVEEEGTAVDVQARRMSVDDVRSAIGPHGASCLVYICGPPAMTDGFAEALTRSPGAVIDRERVMTEKWW
ncbi:ap-1 complex subunit gamma-1 [Paramyrothecium foliicola]|nr:ap-1 complex subunit gamma-1 [Paramyrothecium foliicola]